MCRTNGLKNIYESELNRKSKYYAVFDALLRNFREAEAAADCKADTFEICKMGKILIADERSYKDYQTEPAVPLCSRLSIRRHSQVPYGQAATCA